jgi:hypothetical protein
MLDRREEYKKIAPDARILLEGWSELYTVFAVYAVRYEKEREAFKWEVNIHERIK